VSTEPVRKAAEAWLASLKPDQRKAASFAVDSEEWRKWMNQHFYQRQGVSFLEMDEQQRGLAMGLLRASLSARGMKLTEDIMHLDTTLGELNNNNFEEYGERRYWITIMGTPSTKEPWGWQIDGHHLIVNYFVLGDQVVMTPTFTGSEPVIAKGGKYAGTTILQEEQNGGLRLVRSLSDAQRKKAVLQVSKTGNNNLTEAFKDNVVLDYQGLKGSEMDAEQKKALLALVERYVGNLKEGHAKVRMEEVKRHLESTWFAWIGDTSEGGVFYYRVHSPVVLIEFDHQLPVGIRHLYPGGRPVPEHVHTVVRTPNGNDYGKDLLRQHYAAMRH
jgi:predicted nuclease of restriction endonuclease-like (RecB) superfamily